MATKPTVGHLEWITDDDAAKYIEPSAAKKLQGWIASEKPPFQYFNWLVRLIDRWLQWAEAQSDENAAAITANAQAISTHAGMTDNPHAVNKAQVGLGSVPDTDFTAAVAANTAHRGQTNNPHAVTKAQVGLGSVPDTDFTAAVASNTVHRQIVGNPHQLAIEGLGLYSGLILGNGTAGYLPPNWSVSRGGTGTYTITFGGLNFGNYYSFVATASSGSLPVVVSYAVSQTSVTVYTNVSFGGLTDSNFSFFIKHHL